MMMVVIGIGCFDAIQRGPCAQELLLLPPHLLAHAQRGELSAPNTVAEDRPTQRIGRAVHRVLDVVDQPAWWWVP